MKGLKQFAEWLVARKLSFKTVKQYLIFYRLFERELGKRDLSQEFINQFMIRHTSSVAKGFLTNVLEFYELTQFKSPKVRGRKAIKIRRSISPQEIKELREWIYKHKAYKYGLMTDLSYYCALRREEICKITLNDFELKAWAEDVHKPCRLKIHGKGSKERPVIVPPKLMMRIVKWIKKKQDLSPKERLFGVGTYRWHEVFVDSVKQSGLSHKYTLHDLRRSRGTIWINELGIYKAKERLGHADIGTTQRYFNKDQEKELQEWENEY